MNTLAGWGRGRPKARWMALRSMSVWQGSSMFEALLTRVAQQLEGAGLPYMVIGDQAVLLYGEPPCRACRSPGSIRLAGRRDHPQAYPRPPQRHGRRERYAD